MPQGKKNTDTKPYSRRRDRDRESEREQNVDVEFIITTTPQRPGGEDRKTIRSHVMKGKNRRKRLQELPSWINLADGTSGDNQRKSTPAAPIPSKIGSDLSLLRFPEDMKQYMMEDVIKFFTLIKNGMYPFELCVKFDPRDSIWYGHLMSDVVYLHSMIFTTQTFQDMQSSRKLGPLALSHLTRTVSLLKERLAANDDMRSISDATIMVVMTLAVAAGALGDRDAALHHMNGLCKMIELRGGFDALKDNRGMLQTKICRTDLGIALSFGFKPFFLLTAISWKSYVASRGLIFGGLCQVDDMISKFSKSLDEKLAIVWEDLREFSKFANLAYQTKRKIDPEMFHEIMVSVAYRLLRLRFSNDLVNEVIRAGMLTFTSTIFLQWQSMRIRYSYMISLFRNALQKLQVSDITIPPLVLLWLLMVWGVSIPVEIDQEWYSAYLLQTIQLTELRSWADVCTGLKSIMWIEFMHNGAGERMLGIAMARLRLSERASTTRQT